jgi:hypothetical protein
MGRKSTVEGLHEEFMKVNDKNKLLHLRWQLTGSNTDMRVGIDEFPHGLFGQCLVA